MKDVERLVERDAALRRRAQPGERVEVLDRRVRAAGEAHAGVEQLPVGIGVAEAVGPQPGGELAVAGRVRVLDRRGDPEAGVARDVVRMDALGVLDAVAQPERPPHVLGRLEAVERLAVGEVADRVDGDGHPGRGGVADDRGEPLRPHQPHPAAADQQRGARAERAVHEHLHVAAARRVGAGHGLPHAQAQLAGLAQRRERLGRAARAVLVVHAGHTGGVGGGQRRRGPRRASPPAWRRRGRRRSPRRRARAAARRRLGPRCAAAAPRVHPQRVAVVGAQGGRDVAGDGVERRARRPLALRPLLLAPPAAAQPASASARGLVTASLGGSPPPRSAPAPRESERVPNSRSSRRPSAQLGKCTWASTSPGTTVAPPRSICSPSASSGPILSPAIASRSPPATRAR